MFFEIWKKSFTCICIYYNKIIYPHNHFQIHGNVYLLQIQTKSDVDEKITLLNIKLKHQHINIIIIQKNIHIVHVTSRFLVCFSMKFTVQCYYFHLDQPKFFSS